MTRSGAAGNAPEAFTGRSRHRRHGNRGMAIPAVLALLMAVSILVLAHAALISAHWLAARNLREGLHAWARVESATAVAVAELAEAHRRRGELPDAYDLADSEAIEVSLEYAKHSSERADLTVLAAFGRAAVRRRVEVDMTQ